MLRALALFMAWKQALAFTLASELIQHDAVYCAGISPKERFACLARIQRDPKPWTAKSFGPVEWLPSSAIDPAVIELLPSGAREMTAKDLATVRREWQVFGCAYPDRRDRRLAHSVRQVFAASA